jgi:DHA2 family multidrug resistance protein
MCCGIAQSLEQIVIFRTLQGLTGAALAPLSQATLLDIYPPEGQARAMAIWTMGITVAPILGPALGGWLTENHSWRWVFYINVPVGLLCMAGIASFMQPTRQKRIPFDTFGFITLSVAIFTLQLALDRGPSKDWFESSEILVEVTCAMLAGYLFAVHSMSVQHPFVDLRMFRDRNFLIGCGIIFVLGIPMFAPLVLLPTMLQGLLKIPVITSGLITAPRGFGMLAGAMLLGTLARFLDPRMVIAGGFAVSAIALSQMCGFFLQMHQSLVMWTGLIQGFGNGLAFVPLATLTFGTLGSRYRADGASAYNLIRNLGSSIGVAIVQAVYINNSQVLHARLAEHVTPYGTHLQGQPDLASTAGLIAMEGRVSQQAAMLAYVNVFKLMFMLAALCIPLVLLFRKASASEQFTSAAAHE